MDPPGENREHLYGGDHHGISQKWGETADENLQCRVRSSSFSSATLIKLEIPQTSNAWTNKLQERFSGCDKNIPKEMKKGVSYREIAPSAWRTIL